MQTGSHQVRDVTEDSTNNGIQRRNNQLPISEPPLTEGLGHVERIDAITFASADMDASVVFYQALGFVISFGDISSPFVTLESGNCFVNLWEVERSALPTRWWGRTIFHVDDALAPHARHSTRTDGILARMAAVYGTCTVTYGRCRPHRDQRCPTHPATT